MKKIIILFVLTALSGIVYAQNKTEALSPVTVTSPVKAQLKPLDNTAVKRWEEFLGKLSQCSTGTFELLQIDPDLLKFHGAIETYEIKGKQKDKDEEKCFVTRMLYKKDDPRLVQQETSQSKDGKNDLVGFDCKFVASSIKDVVAYYTDLLNRKEMPPVAEAYTKAVAKDCKMFFMKNGERVYQ